MSKKADTVRMIELSQQGLSNAQIAKEMGVHYNTVLNHLGKQKTGVRSEYGSLVSHSDGDSFTYTCPTTGDTYVTLQPEYGPIEPPKGFMPCSKRIEEEKKAESLAVRKTEEMIEFKGKTLRYRIHISYINDKVVRTIEIYDQGISGAMFTLPYDICQDMITELIELLG